MCEEVLVNYYLGNLYTLHSVGKYFKGSDLKFKLEKT
jgi:hypothetical protein